MIEAGARAAFDALIDGRTSGPLRFDQLPAGTRSRVLLRFGIGLRAALYAEQDPAPVYGMTPAQQRCLDAIAAHIDKHGHAPNYREICEALGLRGRGNITRLLDLLERRGYVRRLPGRQRSVEIIRRDKKI